MSRTEEERLKYNEYQREWAKNNPDKTKKARADYKNNHPEQYRLSRKKYNDTKYRDRREKIDKIKLDRGCVDCGYREFACALDFDHVRGEKLGTLAHIAVRNTWEDVLIEIAKCEVRCSNCHRVKSWQAGKSKIAYGMDEDEKH